jgi:hypothetical protein
MNCKKGDIAMYIGTDPIFAEQRGKLFECVEFITDIEGKSGWMTDPRPRPGSSGFLDEVLRPLGKPGEHEVDEMLLVTGKPREVST